MLLRLFFLYFFVYLLTNNFANLEKMERPAAGKTAEKRKRHDLTLKEKHEVIQEIHKHVPYDKIAMKFKCSVSQICHIADNRTEIERCFENNLNSKAKRLKTAPNRDINEAVWHWYQSVAEKNIPLSS